MSFFADKVVLVTGGASGIGRALGAELGQRGARVVFADLDADGAESAARQCREQGADVGSIALDVTDLEAFRKQVDELVQSHGRIDILFNNAGIGVTGEFRDLPSDAWSRVLEVNLKGVIHGIQAVYPHMIRQGHGHIANTACVAGLVPLPMTSAYSASKHAVVGLSGSMRAEAAREGVRVSVICPGIVDTDMFDSIEYFGVDKQALISPVGGAMMTPEICAKKILRGVEKNRAVILIGLHARLMWWLYRLAPRPFLRLVGLGFRLFRKQLQK